MSYNNSKTISRFQFNVSRNNTSKKAGSNVVTIATLPADGQKYALGTTQLSMTVKEAVALKSFLDESLSDDVLAVG
tara:strand:- start:1314 stop:1541 length:228 start_codon:yes stop_codon:yes gene_type:complete